MVDINVGGHITREHTTFVQVPLGSINVHGQRSNVSQGRHNSVVIVRFKVHITLDSGGSSHFALVESAVRSSLTKVLAEVRLVGVGPFRSHSVFHHGLIGKLSNTTFATTSSTTLLRVVGTVEDLLFRQDGKLVSSHGSVGLDLSSRGKSPARTTLTLILNSSEDSLSTPINFLRKSLDDLLRRRRSKLPLSSSAHTLVVTMHTLQFCIKVISEMVDTHFEGGLFLVVFQDTSQVLSELLSSQFNFRFFIFLSPFLHVNLEGVIFIQLVPFCVF
mmetsp:Transcript_34011/g.53201  ORF Transcript_34011/g.53201 Transcript_34011/m.53201 type:complete len:274 (-) Transcript_34011:80-901(-)